MYSTFDMEPKIVDLITKVNQPVSIGWVASNLGVAWATARDLLQEMVRAKKLKRIPTTRANLFAV